MNQQRVIGSIVIILGSLVVLPFLGIKKCHFDQRMSEVTLVKQRLINKNTYQILPETVISSCLDDVEENKVNEVVYKNFPVYALQIGAFKETKRLNELVKILKKMDLNPIIQQIKTQKGILYKLIVGGNNREQLKELAEQLKEKLKVEPIVVKFVA